MVYPRERYRSSYDRKGRSGLRIAILITIVVGAGLVTVLVLLSAPGGRGLSFAGLDAVVAAREAFEDGRFEEAIGHAEAVLAEEPLNASALVVKGFSHYHRGVNLVSVEDRNNDLDAAVVALRRSLLLSDVPVVERVHHVLGKAYYHKGPFFVDQAVVQLEESVARGYDHNESYEYLGLAYADLENYRRSADSYLLALRTRPVEERDVLYVFLAQSYRMLGELDEASHYLRLAVQGSDDSFLVQEALFGLGEVLTEMGNYEQAVLQYEAVLERNPESAEAHVRLGDLYETMGSLEEARFEWRRALEVDSRNVEALERLSD